MLKVPVPETPMQSSQIPSLDGNPLVLDGTRNLSGVRRTQEVQASVYQSEV